VGASHFQPHSRPGYSSETPLPGVPVYSSGVPATSANLVVPEEALNCLMQFLLVPLTVGDIIVTS
jgi:hypothetical protein